MICIVTSSFWKKVLDKYEIGVTSEKISAYVISGSEYINISVDEHNKLSILVRLHSKISTQNQSLFWQ